MLATRMMSDETVLQFEKMIYLPMLLTILDKDGKILNETPVKFKSPYLAIIKKAMDNVQKDLAETHLYFCRNRMKLIKEGNDGEFTTYIFTVGQEQYTRKYMNFRLRNRTEELMSIYFNKK